MTPLARERLRAAVVLGGLLFALALVNAWVLAHDVRVDVSFRPASAPGPAVRALLARLAEPLEVTLIFPPHDEVHAVLEPYFAALAASSPRVKLRSVDASEVPELAGAHDGMVVFRVGGHRERLEVGRDLAAARRVLRALDGHVAHRLNALLAPRRRVYVTRGHGERELANLSELVRLLAGFNVELVPLGIGEGLGGAPPSDAAAVMVLGPSRPWLAAEVESLRAHVARGGALWLALEPGAELGFAPLHSDLGVRTSEAAVACTEHHLVRTHRPVDRELLYTSAFASPRVLPLSAGRLGDLSAVFVRAAALEAVDPTRLEPVVHTAPDCFLDADADHELGSGQRTATYTLLARVGLPSGARVVLSGDADFVSDQVLGNEANTLIALDLMRFLLGPAQLPALPLSADDVPLQHRRESERAYFYLSTVAVPLALFAWAIAVWRRRSRGGLGEL
jgi:hypothetical protein